MIIIDFSFLSELGYALEEFLYVLFEPLLNLIGYSILIPLTLLLNLLFPGWGQQ